MDTALARLVAQSVHLLAPTFPPYSRIDILYSRIDHDPDWGPQAVALASQRTHPAFANARSRPDLPDPALRRIITVGTDSVLAVEIAPDSTWLASICGTSREVRLWDTKTGALRATLRASRA